jgi:diacylglycerol kinase
MECEASRRSRVPHPADALIRVMKTRGIGANPSRQRHSWSAIRSAYHALSGLLWVAPRTPSLKLGITIVAALVGVGLAIGMAPVEVAAIVIAGVVLLAVETLNTAIEMLADALHPQRDPAIGKVKDVAAAATVITEIGVAVVMIVLLVPNIWTRVH